MKFFFEFTRFCIIGVGNTTINYVTYIFLLKILNLHYLLAGAIAYLGSSVFGFMMNRKWTFKVNVATATIFIYFMINSFSMLVNGLVQWVTVRKLQLPVEFSQLYGIVVTTFINYFLIRRLVFKKPLY